MKKFLSVLLAILLLGISCMVPTFAVEPAAWVYDFNDGTVPASSGLKFARATSSLSASVQNGALSLSGTIAQTVTQTNTYISFYIPVSGLKVDTVYNVSGKYKLTSGSINSLAFGSFGGTGLSGTNGMAYGNIYKAINNKATSVMADFVPFSGKFTSTATTSSGKTGVDNTNPKYLIIGMYSSSISAGTTITLLVDDLVFSEVVSDKVEVEALSSDTNMGTVTLAKQGDSSTDFIKGDNAVFSAFPKDGYEFVNWTDANGIALSNKTSYAFLNLTEDTTLTANFRKADYLNVTYDYESTAFDAEKFGTNKRYTWKHIATANNSSDAIDGTSLQLELCPPEDPGTGVKRGYLAEDKAYMLKAGNLYHLEITAKALSLGSTPVDISLVTLKSGDPTSAIRDNVVKKHNGSAAVFYTSSTKSTTTKMVIEPTVDGYLAYYSVYAQNAVILIDNIVITEVIDDAEGNALVKATANSTMGEATVTNPVSGFNDTIARGDSAIFNATAKDGYSFKAWQDENGNTVSTSRAYQIDNVQSPVALNAVFEKLAEGEVRDGQYVIDFEVTPNANLRDNKSDATSSATIVSNGINGKSLEFTAKYNDKDTHYTSYFIKMNGLKANSVYTVKGKYQVTNGVLPKLRVGLIAFNSGATQGYTQSGEYLAVVADTSLMSEATEFTGYIQTNETEAPKYLVISTLTTTEVTFLIDDLELSESDYQPFYGHGDIPKKDTVINFDDYYITTTRPLQIRVDEAPERDGKKTDALHILKTEGLGAAILNWGTTTTNKDRWFTVPVKENTLYKWSMWVYIPSIRPGNKGHINYMTYNIDYTNNISVSLKYMEERDEWVKLEKTFTTKPGQTKLSMNFNAGDPTKEMWLDDFSIVEISAGTMQYTNLSYCEEAYNLFAKSPHYKDILNGKSGIYEIETDASAQYTFSITTIGGNSNSKVYLSFDGKNIMSQSEENAPLAFAKANTTRLGTELVSASNKKLYLIIENPDNTMKIQNIKLFRTKSLGTNRDMGYESDPNLPDPVLTVENLTPIGKEDVNGEAFDGSPATGDVNTVLPAVIIAVTALLLALLVGYRRKEEC